MNKNDIINQISQDFNKTKKDVGLIIDAFLDHISNTLKNNEKVAISNFGTFSKNITKPMNIYSPYDGKLIKNVKQTRIHFKSSPNLIKSINNSNDKEVK